MQENVKNVFENIAESVRSQHIIEAADANCASPDPIDPLKMTESLVPGGKLCIRNTLLNQTEYFIGHKLWNNWVRVTNIDECAEFTKASLNWEAENDDNICRVLKNDGTRIFPLTNNFVAIESLDFFVNNDKIPKVYMRMILRPAARKWLAVNILDNNRMYVQTSISERFIATQ